jgi:uncharacterized protein DUF3224
MTSIIYNKKQLTTTASFLILAAILLLPAVHATTPTTVTGPVLVENPTFQFIRTAGNLTFYTIGERDLYSGAFNGTTIGNSTLAVDSTTGSFTVHGLHTFTGTVNGIQGTLIFQIVATGTFGLSFLGQFTIVSGTGGLTNLHGEGTLQGIPGYAGTYTAQIHFDPSQ